MVQIKNTKEKIIEVAKNLFMKKGVDKTSVRDIAKSAGINIAALNYHFRSKESLFDMIFEHVLVTSVPSLPKILNSNLLLDEKITQYVNAYIDILVKNPQLPFFVISVLNRDPKRIKKLKVFQLLYNTQLFNKQLKDEAEKGNIRSVNPEHFFLNMQALINFPFTIKDAISESNMMDDAHYSAFIEERRITISETLLLSLRPIESKQTIKHESSMYLHAVTHYYPEERVSNEYYSKLLNMDQEEIVKKSGIKERRRCAMDENANTMSIEVVRRIIPAMKFPITDIDLVIAGSYTPFDTVATAAHVIQKEFNIANARSFMLSSACSSFVVAAEIAEGFFLAGKAKNALIIVAEHNSAYNEDKNPISGFLWGDGAAAAVITADRQNEEDMEILDITSQGLGHVGKGPEGVYNRLTQDRLIMPDGKDVFVNATQFMVSDMNKLLERNNLKVENLSYLVPHQANIRIINKVGKDLGINKSKVITNIEYLGNTGCASSIIALSENYQKFCKNDLIGITVFGGGYSSGSMLLRK